MKVLIDGKEVNCINDVKVIYNDVPVAADTNGDLQISVNTEGIIFDTFVDNKPYLSAYHFLDDIIAETH